VYPADGEYYEYYNEDTTTRKQAVIDLESYVKHEGPFDGVIGFSGGAALAATLLILHGEQNPPFKVAIFFSSVPAMDPLALMENDEKPVHAKNGPLIHIPTAHVWGKNDTEWAEAAAESFELCHPESRQSYVHDGGHEIPGGKDKEVAMGVAQTIQRAINAAQIV
jgi:pimeloyl-ACP methyl ester carboxylesterase